MTPQTISLENVQYMDSKIDGLIWYARRMPKGTQIILDFGKVEFLRPEAVVLLIVACKMVYDKVETPILWKNLPDGGVRYLYKIRIDQIEFIDIDKNFFHLLQFKTKQDELVTNLIPLKIIKNDSELVSLVEALHDRLAEWFPYRPNNFANDACTIVSEIVGNSLEHSTSKAAGENPICYFTVQRYWQQKKNGSPKEARAIIAVGDVGMGIAGSLNTTHNIYKDLSAIKKAFYEGVSSREDLGGLGFMSVASLLKENRGRITIRSGKGAITYVPAQNKKREGSHKESLIGTQTAIFF